ncbi:hypothetical protein WLH_03166 [Escherichia coli O25b:H4]|uniref:Uncharacterized protein n=2 Tax=Escherichia coli TaxID=562 RepID=A0A192CFA6_ECO25|nr:hypothetical protein WLH_03166 [Escherichia coli O25b:H4]EGI13499.1 conserved hypothetical protein [Escherichia coli M605]
MAQFSLYLFYGDTAHLIADFVTTTTMTNPGELKYVR